MRNCHQFLSVKKLFYIFLLMILPACAESNSSLPESSSNTSSVPNKVKKQLAFSDSQKKKITLEGSYEFRSDQTSLEIRGKQICFFPNENSYESIPRSAGDIRFPWFCFANTEYAASSLNVSLQEFADCGIEGLAKIVVSDYKIYKGEGSGNDVAKLIEVLEKSNAHPLPCEKKLIDHPDLKKELSDFEKMLEGFSECKFENVYVEYVSKKPLHDYFIKWK